MQRQLTILLGAIGIFQSVALTRNRSKQSEHWVSTWATAQQFARTATPGGGRVGASSQAAQSTKARFGDIQLHVEWMVPKGGNSNRKAHITLT